MEKVCIKFLIIFIVLILLLTNDIRITATDIIISIVTFIFLYKLLLCIGKYLKQRKERQQIDLLIKKLERCIER